MMEKIIAERNELLQELMTESLPLIDPEHEITAKMYACAAGISISAAMVRLKKLVKEGSLTSRKVKLEDGHQCTAYRKVT